jgi:hypothetical protein
MVARGAMPLAAALTDSGLLLIVVVGGLAIVAFLVFVVREALSRPVEVPRELPPPHDLPPLGDDPVIDAAGSPPRDETPPPSGV